VRTSEQSYRTGDALLSGLGLMRCGVCGSPMVVFYSNPNRVSRKGRSYRGSPFVYISSKEQGDGRKASCQSPAGPYIDRAVTGLVLYALGELDLDGIHAAMQDRQRQVVDATRLKVQELRALEHRAEMLEHAIESAQRPELVTRLVAKLEVLMGELDRARRDATSFLTTAQQLASVNFEFV
jgi:hypothetical protein